MRLTALIDLLSQVSYENEYLTLRCEITILIRRCSFLVADEWCWYTKDINVLEELVSPPIGHLLGDPQMPHSFFS